MRKIFILLLFAIGAQSVFSETIWCKSMKIGCTTPEEREKAFKHCEKMAQNSYRRSLAEASSDPSIWQLAGYANAYAYAEARGRLSMSLCIKNTPVLNRE